VQGNHHLYALLSSAVLLAVAPLCLATSLNFTLKPGQVNENSHPLKDDKLQSGLQLAMHNELLKLAVNYNVQATVDDLGAIDNNSAQQRLGATVRSKRLDQLLGGTTQLQTNSLVRTGTDGYSHQLNPAFSRSLLDIATVDIKYGYLLSKASARAAENKTQSYFLGLRGSLPGGQVNWSGAYSSSSTFRDHAAPSLRVENFKFQSEYRVAPTMKLQLFSNIKQQTQLAASQEVSSAESRYGAGLTWIPSGRYSLDLKVDRRDQSQSGEQELLRSGSVSWFPTANMALSLNYGDQLVEGERGIVFNTRLEFDRF
jgi:hypothetical protein